MSKQTIRTLKPGDELPVGPPRRYLKDGYIRLRWLVAPSTYVEVYEHRLNAGLPDSRMHVHHINGVKTDNRPENLQVLSASEHRNLHGADPDWLYRATRKMSEPLSEYPRCGFDECARAATHNSRTLCGMHYKERKRRLEGKPRRARLTVSDVDSIRTRKGRATTAALAAEFSVSKSTIRRALSNQSWKQAGR